MHEPDVGRGERVGQHSHVHSRAPAIGEELHAGGAGHEVGRDDEQIGTRGARARRDLCAEVGIVGSPVGLHELFGRIGHDAACRPMHVQIVGAELRGEMRFGERPAVNRFAQTITAIA